jgi:hypothetical protein
MEPVMAKAMAEVDLSIFLAKTFCDTTFFSSLDDICIVDEKRSEWLGLRDLFSSPSGVESEVRRGDFFACDELLAQGQVLGLRHG